MIMRTRLSNMKAKLKDVHFFLIFRFRGVCKNIVFFFWYGICLIKKILIKVRGDLVLLNMGTELKNETSGSDQGHLVLFRFGHLTEIGSKPYDNITKMIYYKPMKHIELCFEVSTFYTN